MNEREQSAESLEKETELLKEIADQVVEERESGASAFAVPEDHDDAAEPEDDDEPGVVDELPKAVPHTRR